MYEIVKWRPQLDHIYHMDALTFLGTLEDESVNCIVTSPPYYGLRDYGVAGQIGLEDSPDAFVARMVALFREARRVLRSDGTLWLNLGDSYASGPRGNRTMDNFKALGWTEEHCRRVANDYKIDKLQNSGLKPKDLIGIPWRVAFALQADSWYLRSDVIWHKPNPMPESVTDRPTKSHEYLFLLSKSERYWYDADAIREPAQEWSGQAATFARTGKVSELTMPGQSLVPHRSDRTDTIDTSHGRNKRSVWTVATQPYSDAHFATFPPALIEPCIQAGCPAQVCVECGAPWVRVVERTPMVIRKTDRSAMGEFGRTQSSGTMLSPARAETVGFEPTCACKAATRPGVTLDMFMGAGTTALVAKQQGRHYLGCDLNAEYVEMATLRVEGSGIDRLNAKTPEPMTALPLFAAIESEAS